MTDEYVKVYDFDGDARLMHKSDVGSVDPHFDKEIGGYRVSCGGFVKDLGPFSPKERPSTPLPAPYGLHELQLDKNALGWIVPTRSLLGSCSIDPATGIARLANFYGETPRFVINEAGDIFNGLDGEEISTVEFWRAELRRLFEARLLPSPPSKHGATVPERLAALQAWATDLRSRLIINVPEDVLPALAID